MPKIGLTYVISIVKYFFFFFFFFFNFFPRKYFSFSFAELNYINVSQQYCENFRKIEQAELQATYLPYRFLHNVHTFLLREKVKKKWKK